MKKYIIAALGLFGFALMGGAQTHHSLQTEYPSYKGLVMAGYQGWFRGDKDGTNQGFGHYGLKKAFDANHCTIDIWPDVSEYEKTYETSFRHADGTVAKVFSSADSSSVDLHFKWMQDYGVDGVFMQRFWGTAKGDLKSVPSRILGNALKSAISHQQNIFEGLNIRYFGPFDGHNVKELVRILRQLKDMKGPKLLHLHTTKGKGYEPAEKAATIWHAPGKFDPATGERINSEQPGMPPKYQDVFGHTLLELAGQNPKIVGVTPAMPTGCSMNIMMEAMPDRVFDVGIAEGHAVTFSGGMAKDGLQPFCNIYSAFAQRAYDNIIHDVAIMRLPVVICLDRAGLVGEDGATHHGAFDMAALRPIPNLTIASPMDECELRRLMYTAQLPGKGTFVIRYPRGHGVRTDWRCPLEELTVGTGRRLKEGRDVAVLTIGPIGNTAATAINEVELRHEGLCVAHYDMRFVKPLDEKLLGEVAARFSRIITVEDGSRSGGFGSAVLEWMADHGHCPRIVRLGLPDNFVEHGTVAELQHITGIDKEGIAEAIENILTL